MLGEIADDLCAVYQDWPQAVLDEASVAALAARVQSLNEIQRQELSQSALVDLAAARCGEVLAPAGLTANHELPRPGARLVDLPGLFDPQTPQDSDHERARYEWTAIGLGCLGLSPGDDALLREQETQLLAAMGYSLDGYIQASLAQSDEAMSERIFGAVLRCAERASATVPE